MLKAIFRRWLVRWLEERALVLPQQKRKELAKRLGVDEDFIREVEAVIRQFIIEEVIGK